MCSLEKRSLLSSLSLPEVVLICLKLEQFEQDFLYPLLLENVSDFPLLTKKKIYILAKGYRIRLFVLRYCFFYLRAKHLNIKNVKLENRKKHTFFDEKERFFDFSTLTSTDVDLMACFDKLKMFKSKILYPYLYNRALVNQEYQLAKIFFCVSLLVDRNNRVFS